MKPFLLKPATKSYLWGGTLLAERYGKTSTAPTIAESWELSAHPNGSSVVATGPYRGLPFADFCQNHPEAVSPAFRPGVRFPLMIKLIDAAKPLSVQVHPGDTYAWQHEGEPGKTEAWFILDSAPDAYLYCGFARNTSREEVARRIADNTLEDVLNKLFVQKGDLVYVPAGTVHAIGQGLLVAEVQENSDSTYRVYDYGRVGDDGQPRALHIEKALDVLDYGKAHVETPGSLPPAAGPQWQAQQLVSCPYFAINRLALDGGYTSDAARDAFECVLCIEGGAVLAPSAANLVLTPGCSAFVPAGTAGYRLEGRGTFLLCGVPSAAAGQPGTESSQ